MFSANVGLGGTPCQGYWSVPNVYFNDDIGDDTLFFFLFQLCVHVVERVNFPLEPRRLHFLGASRTIAPFPKGWYKKRKFFKNKTLNLGVLPFSYYFLFLNS